MSSKEINFDYKIPELVQNQITEDLLRMLKKELDERFKLLEDDEKPTYLNTYAYLVDTKGWKEAFQKACIAERAEGVYDHYVDLEWYNKEAFDDEIAFQLMDRNIIERGQEEGIENFLK